MSLKPLLPLVLGLTDIEEKAFLTPTMLKVTSPRFLKKYKAPQQDQELYNADPKPDSIIARSVRRGH